MNMDSLKVGFACFLGAFIGALLALELPGQLWWLGVLVGGAVGYIGFSFKEIPTTVARVWRELPDGKSIFTSVLAVGCVITTGLSVFAMIVACMVGTVIVFSMPGLHAGPVETDLCEVSLWMIPTVTLILLACGFRYLYHDNDKSKQYVMCLGPLCFIPGVLWLLVVVGLPVVILYAGWRSMKILAMVGWRTLRLVHSDVRLLCMTDAAVGALIGYWCGSALVGGMAGLVLGIINYEFVSVRWWKLIPRRL